MASAVSVGVTWYLTRSHQSGSVQGGEIESWNQLVPEGADNIKTEEFGETNLQARLVTKRLPVATMRQRAEAFFNLMNSRRTMRFYSSDEVPKDILDKVLATAGTSPSGAHHQPWFFAVIRDPTMKQKVRDLVEAEEKVNYEKRMRKSWIQDLSSMTGEKADKRLLTDSGAPQKPYLTEAPAIVAMFKQTHALDAEGKRIDNYYVNESCGIAAGFFLAALHNVGLASLTSTPMGSEQAIREMLGRPDNEKLFLLLPVGYPADDATVPYRTPMRKEANQLSAIF